MPSTISTLLWELDFKATALVIFANLTLFLQDWTFLFDLDQGHLSPTANFHAGPNPQVHSFLIVPPAWTLGVELTFYLIAPLFARRWYMMLLLFATGLTVRLAIGFWHPGFDPG